MTLDMTSTFLSSDGLKERVMFLSSWVFVIGTLILLAYFVHLTGAFTRAFVKASGQAKDRFVASRSNKAVVAQTAGFSSDASSWKYQVKIKFQKVVLSDGAVQTHYDWRVVEDRSGSRFTADLREGLDRSIQCFCNNLGQDPNTAAGEHDLVQRFN
jgi:hypothetical protein